MTTSRNDTINFVIIMPQSVGLTEIYAGPVSEDPQTACLLWVSIGPHDVLQNPVCQ